jgi:hypothetical protein
MHQGQLKVVSSLRSSSCFFGMHRCRVLTAPPALPSLSLKNTPPGALSTFYRFFLLPPHVHMPFVPPIFRFLDNSLSSNFLFSFSSFIHSSIHPFVHPFSLLH